VKVIVETPKWSFTKYHTVRGKTEREFLSPLPNLFNYGYIPGTKAADGMEKDVIVLGARMPQGPADVVEAGVVSIIDDGLADDKVIASADGKVTEDAKIRIHIFFSAYMAYKAVRYLVAERRLAKCSYGGFTLSPRR